MSAVPICSSCRREVPPSSRFCPSCGWDLRDGRGRLQTGLLPANRLLYNRYQVVQRLAQGGQSAVYLVHDTLDGGKQRAVKEMSEAQLGPLERDKAVNDFLREADMLRALDHPALAKVYDRFVDNHKHYLVMEYVHGHNLEDELIETGRPLAPERVRLWGIALCNVLAYLHSRVPPIIYRDLKPANVMLQPDDSIKLIDFGIARWLHPMRAQDTSKLGTDGYAPLEQYNARSEPRSDLYALGASLYHLLTGRVPEAAPMRSIGERLTPLRTVNRQVTEPLEQVILRALSLQTEDRFADAEQMGQALEWAGTGTGGSPGMPGATGAGDGQAAGTAAHATPAHATFGRAATTSAGSLVPKLQVRPLRLDAGFLEMDDEVDLILEVANPGGGTLQGRTDTNLACITVQPSRLDANAVTLQIRIVTTGLRPGPYTCHIAIRTNGGDQIVPVRFVVRPPIGAHQYR